MRLYDSQVDAIAVIVLLQHSWPNTAGFQAAAAAAAVDACATAAAAAAVVDAGAADAAAAVYASTAAAAPSNLPLAASDNLKIYTIIFKGTFSELAVLESVYYDRLAGIGQLFVVAVDITFDVGQQCLGAWRHGLVHIVLDGWVEVKNAATANATAAATDTGANGNRVIQYERFI